ncbi:ScyD/ScyE family protein [uncultured Serinicoccus sp.]|uniref:ScyD/ScyE family protein n=1 Tax=uncultured Serinicoccus sp. TaxID=735514 RepID=UPI002605F8BE|nr:ScyD/ScyE family protein [uncultured Serinicoccus sp.]
MRRSTLAVAASVLALTASLLTAPAQARTSEPRVVVDGLVGPLSLAVGSGHVYLTQNFSGQLSKVKRGTVRTVYQVPETGSLGGVAASRGKTYHLESDFSGETPTSHVVRTSWDGTRTVVSDDLWQHEIQNNPDAGVSYGFVGLNSSCAAELGAWEEASDSPPLSEYTGIVESNAYQLEVSGHRAYVADAAANAILEVDLRTGDISTAAVLPVFDITFTEELKAGLEASLPPGADPLPDCLVGEDYVPESVPTDVAVDHKGRLYVTTLGGVAGEIVPLSRVYRIDRHGHATTVARGLHGATGLDRSRDGHLVVAELFGGEVSVVRPGSSKARTLFNADSPADVALSGKRVYATTGAFGNGALVTYDLGRRR